MKFTLRYNIARKGHITTSNALNRVMLLLIIKESYLNSFNFSKLSGGAYQVPSEKERVRKQQICVQFSPSHLLNKLLLVNIF